MPPSKFGPRIALAWSPVRLIPGRQTVIRAGYGIYYDTIPLNISRKPSQNPIGPTAGFTLPGSAYPIRRGMPIFGSGAPQPPFNIASIDPHLKTRIHSSGT